MNPLAALQFLTILPIRTQASGSGAAWFPLIGALLGLAAAAVCWAIPSQGPLLAIAALALITGGLHEDGLADVCDALRAYRTREKMIAILHDSRIGAHGALALVFSVSIRWQALAHLQGDRWVRLAVALAVSRAAMVWMASSLPAPSTGLGAHFKRSLSSTVWTAVAAQYALGCALLGWPAGVWLPASQFAVLLPVRQWFQARLGGCNGDCLGFTCQVSEAAALIALGIV